MSADALSRQTRFGCATPWSASRCTARPSAALLPGITVPTLTITGEQHSGWTPAQNAAAITTMPDGRAAVVADAAYLVPLEQPDAVVGLVRDFWASAATEVPGAQR